MGETFRVLIFTMVSVMLWVGAGCGQPLSVLPLQKATTAPVAKAKKTYRDLIVGYAQLGAESEWRSANTVSVKTAAEQLGVELRFSDAQQKQENQIQAIRSFIAQRVDAIGVAPLVETGWDEVFREAKDAGIPIILVDRRAVVPSDLYVQRRPYHGKSDEWSSQHCRTARYHRFRAGQ
jgi:ABC-type sugar transport system substrate-binding protein